MILQSLPSGGNQLLKVPFLREPFFCLFASLASLLFFISFVFFARENTSCVRMKVTRRLTEVLLGAVQRSCRTRRGRSYSSIKTAYTTDSDKLASSQRRSLDLRLKVLVAPLPPDSGSEPGRHSGQKQDELQVRF